MIDSRALHGTEREKRRQQEAPGSSFPQSPLLDNSTPKGPRKSYRGEAASEMEVRPGESRVQPTLFWNAISFGTSVSPGQGVRVKVGLLTGTDIFIS